jgi:hypothetical protein
VRLPLDNANFNFGIERCRRDGLPVLQ